MQKIYAVLIVMLCSTAFSKGIDIEIWDIGDGSSSEISERVAAKGENLINNGKIATSYNYSLNHPVCGGAYKVCYDISEDADFEMLLKEFSNITQSVSAVDSCPDSDDTWTRQ